MKEPERFLQGSGFHGLSNVESEGSVTDSQTREPQAWFSAQLFHSELELAAFRVRG